MADASYEAEDGAGLIAWFENGKMNQQFFDDASAWEVFLNEVQSRVPKAHICWIQVHWEKRNIYIGTGLLNS